MQQSQKYRKKNIPKAVRITVWNTYITEEIGKAPCYVGCGRSIAQSNFECGHIEPESRGGLTIIDNLRPICGDCNRSMGTRNMHEFMKTFGFKKDLIDTNNKENEIIIDNEDDEIIIIEDNEDDEIIVIDNDEIVIDDTKINTNNPINYFVENCIEYKKGSIINFNDMYDLFSEFCSAFCDKEIVQSIGKEQFIDYFVKNFDSGTEFNVLYDYKFKYEEIDGQYEDYDDEIDETFYDTENNF